MSSEARIVSSLYIKADNLEYQSRPTSFNADVTGRKGPVPGAVNVSINGTTIDFGQLTIPSLCRIANLSQTYKFDYGVWNPGTLEFYPLGEVLPGESYIIRLSRDLREGYTSPGTGTGTGAAGTTEFRCKAEWGAGSSGVNAVIEAFEF